jgi:hypothetical protein
MKLRLPKRHTAVNTEAMLVHVCESLDRGIPVLRTFFIMAGVIAAAARTGILSDFLFVTGLLLQFAIWFQHWWIQQRTR